MLNNLLANFFADNVHYIFFGLFVLLASLVVFSVLIYLKTNRITKNMIVNKFKVVDMNEKNTQDDSLLYTVIITNNSMNPISVSSIGFEHDGDYFNFKNECKAQLDGKNQDLVILPRGSIKLRLFKEQLESAVFKFAKTKKLKTINVYVVGLAGEKFLGKTKVISKKMSKSYKEYYVFHAQEVASKFISYCQLKLNKGIKLNLFEKLRYNKLVKSFKGEKVEYISPVEELKNPTKEIAVEKDTPKENQLLDCETFVEDNEIKEIEDVVSADDSYEKKQNSDTLIED